MSHERDRSERNGSASPEEWRRDFLREHEERMKKVDEALEEAKRAADQREQPAPGVRDRLAG